MKPLCELTPRHPSLMIALGLLVASCANAGRTPPPEAADTKTDTADEVDSSAIPTAAELRELEERVAAGNARAQLKLASHYYLGAGVEKDDERAFALFRAAAEQGLPEAENVVGWCYRDGVGVERDSQRAAAWFRKAAEQGDPEAQVNLASLYAAGDGVEKDLGEAVRLTQQAANQGFLRAQTNLGKAYSSGEGVDQDYAAAAEWYERAASRGDAVAQHDLGLLLMSGLGVPKDQELAVRWFSQSASRGYPPGEFALGKAHDRGDGVPKDWEAAVHWFRKAADHGHLEAQHSLGNAYASGLGVPQSDSDAAAWYYRAAIEGFTQSQWRVAKMIQRGQGFERDPERADDWFRLAAQRDPDRKGSDEDRLDPPHESTPADEWLATLLPGTWATRIDGHACDENPHKVSLGEDGKVFSVRFRQPPLEDSKDLFSYSVIDFGDDFLRMKMDGETRKTDAGELVVWDLALVSPDSYCWRRTDWPSSCSELRTRCVSAD